MDKAYSASGRNCIFSVMLFSTLLGSLLQTSLSTLLPSIMADLDIDAAKAQWLNTIYSLTMGVMIPASAFLLRRFKTKDLYLVSMGVFLAGLVCCSFAESFPVLLTGRMLQAMGAGMSMSMLQVVILTIFPKAKRGTAMGVFGIAASVAPSFAPTLAGFIVEAFGWRMVFQGALVLYLVNIVLALLMMKNVLDTEKIRFDTPSFLLCGMGFVMITMGISNLSSKPFLNWNVALLIAMGFVALVVFVKRQLKQDQPFLNVRVFGNRKCRQSVILSMLLYAGLIAGSILTPMYQQIICGLSPSVSGLIMMPGSLSMALVSPLTGKLYDRYSIRPLAMIGSALMLISCLGYCILDAQTSIGVLVVLFILRNLAVGCLMMPLVTWGMSSLQADLLSHGTAILTSLRTIAGALGSALLISMMSLSGDAGSTGVSMSGMRIAFIGMTIIAIVQMILAGIGTRNTMKNPA